MIYLRNRYYDPSTGQFISRDPLTATTRQPYSYVSDNPLNRVDATGLVDDPRYDPNWQGDNPLAQWSQAAQDLYIRGLGQLQGLQVRMRGFQEDPEHLFNGSPGSWVEHYNMFCDAKAALQETLDSLLRLANARMPAAGAQEAYNALRPYADEVFAYDPAAGGLPSGYRWGGVDDAQIVPDVPFFGGGEDDLFPLEF